MCKNPKTTLGSRAWWHGLTAELQGLILGERDWQINRAKPCLEQTNHRRPLFKTKKTITIISGL